jgi:hypothetical protein
MSLAARKILMAGGDVSLTGDWGNYDGTQDGSAAVIDASAAVYSTGSSSIGAIAIGATRVLWMNAAGELTVINCGDTGTTFTTGAVNTDITLQSQNCLVKLGPNRAVVFCANTSSDSLDAYYVTVSGTTVTVAVIQNLITDASFDGNNVHACYLEDDKVFVVSQKTNTYAQGWVVTNSGGTLSITSPATEVDTGDTTGMDAVFVHAVRSDAVVLHSMRDYSGVAQHKLTAASIDADGFVSAGALNQIDGFGSGSGGDPKGQVAFAPTEVSGEVMFVCSCMGDNTSTSDPEGTIRGMTVDADTLVTTGHVGSRDMLPESSLSGFNWASVVWMHDHYFLSADCKKGAANMIWRPELRYLVTRLRPIPIMWTEHSSW